MVTSLNSTHPWVQLNNPIVACLWRQLMQRMKRTHTHWPECKETPILKPWQGARLIFPVLKGETLAGTRAAPLTCSSIPLGHDFWITKASHQDSQNTSHYLCSLRSIIETLCLNASRYSNSNIYCGTLDRVCGQL